MHVKFHKDRLETVHMGKNRIRRLDGGEAIRYEQVNII